MTILFGTGWEHGTYNLSGTGAINTTAPRTGTYNPRVTGNQQGYLYISGLSLATNYYVAFAAKVTGSNNGSFRFKTNVNENSIRLEFNTAGNISLYTANTLRGSYSMDLTSWHLIEILGNIADSATCTVKVDGVSQISGTWDCKDGTPISLDGFTWYANFSNTFDFDDFTIGTGDWMGDIRYDILMPDADTADEDWTPSTGADSYALVDEKPASDTDYLSSYASADRTILGLANGSWSGKTIQALITGARVWKEAGTAQQAKLIVKSGVTTSVGSAQNLPVTAGYIYRIDEVDPNTSSAWTSTNVDAAQIGFESV